MTDMKCMKGKVNLVFDRGNIGSNTSCKYHPCHYKGQNCSFCYCPFYPCEDYNLGCARVSKKNGRTVWDCSSCLFNHRNDVVEYSFRRFVEMGITSSEDPRLKDVFAEVKERFFRKGRAMMILGTTSDAGKSLTVTAICRLLSRRGYTITPFKSQNMSLNSRVTKASHEISMIQDLQAKASGLANPGSSINPILLKPKGDAVSQVIVEGRPIGDYNVSQYYDDFVPNIGVDVVRKNIEFLKNRYDYVVIEGAGSPAEINLYDKDIANMRVAEISDADCMLVVNAEWGGSFAYVAGTLALLPEDDRKRVKGIIINNLYGGATSIEAGVKELESITGVPIVGIIPHLNVDLPKEDSECFRENVSKGHGTRTVSVIRLPRISNFTDMDPLMLEDVTVKFVKHPDELNDADAIIIPGSKDTFSDLRWLKSTGLFDKIRALEGKIPILGICGGYQMMAKGLCDPNMIESEEGGSTEGLGLFDNSVRWDIYEKHVSNDRAILNIGGGEIEGYQIHMGYNERSGERPLFTINGFLGDVPEGSVNEEKKLYGTYLHGLFERPAFRSYFMSLIGVESRSTDYSEYLDQNINRLADGFEKGLNDGFWELLGVKR